MSRLVVVSLNAAVDQTVQVADFRLEAVNRVVSSRDDAGGKGVNVASFLAHVGHEVVLTGLLGDANAALFARHFAAAGITDACVRVPGATRTNLKIIDTLSGAVTDLNYPGLSVGPDALDAVKARLEERASGLEILVLSGSLPRGLPETTYAELTAWGHHRGALVVLDASGAALAAALDAGPDLIKPNRAELEELLGVPLPTAQAVAAAAQRLRARGVGRVVVSMGAEGAVVCDPEGVFLVEPPSVAVVSTVGAGDAMVAGFVHAQGLGMGGEAAARLATGFSLGALGEIGPRLPALARIEALAAQVSVGVLAV
ncbi:1-phosphofructokinase [Pararhodospirillum photometricum]|uniref:Phosphofructokinase n=1 Tax=Pararhodospirillum photometricum DSM 122 TaxID=1150469 RepID=H6SK14_PARPM|nr:1-phosphofructokinase [Pararhodospirillum photometricum]CCG08329.1 PfkB [Pararhodospirillum photometricum DSM 122]